MPTQKEKRYQPIKCLFYNKFKGKDKHNLNIAGLKKKKNQERVHLRFPSAFMIPLLNVSASFIKEFTPLPILDK